MSFQNNDNSKTLKTPTKVVNTKINTSSYNSKSDSTVLESIDLSSKIRSATTAEVYSNNIYHPPEKFDMGDDYDITDSFKSKEPIEVENGNYSDKHKDLGHVKFDNCTEIPIDVELNDPLNPNDSCTCLSGACETDKYRIISYRSDDSTKQRIKIYDKKTNEMLSEFTTTKLDHTNGLTTDGKNVYVANCGEGENYTKVSKFSIEDALNGKAEITSETFQVQKDGKNEDTNVSGISHDYKNNDTCVTTVGSDMYISKGDGSLYHATKINIDEENAADTNQDICVANNRVYVIRTEHPSWTDKNVDPTEEWNVIDIYNTRGEYIGTKTIDLPGDYTKDVFGNNTNEKYYRELESISYDETTDSFTLYYQSPNWYEWAGGAGTPPHMVVTGVKL